MDLATSNLEGVGAPQNIHLQHHKAPGSVILAASQSQKPTTSHHGPPRPTPVSIRDRETAASSARRPSSRPPTAWSGE